MSIPWSDVGWVVGLTLIVLLSAKELVRAHGGPRTDQWMRGFNLAAVPLLIVFGAAVITRVLAQLAG